MMKALLPLFVLSISLTNVRGQNWKDLATSQPVFVEQIEHSNDPNTAFLNMGFAKHEWSNTPTNRLDDKQVLSVSLVYTRFQTAQSFDQIALNRSRINQLIRKYPSLVESTEIDWILVEQMGAKSRESGKDYFHGFVIQTRPKSTKETASAELKEIEDLLGSFSSPEVESASTPLSEDDPWSTSTAKKSTEDEPTVHFIMDEMHIRTLDNPASFRGGNRGLTDFLIENLVYPKEDLKNGVEGMAMVAFTVNEKGEVEGVRNLNSISPTIDAEAIRVMKLSPLWKAAVDEGKKVPSNYTIPIQFDVDGDGVAPPPVVGKTIKSLKFVPFGQDEVVQEALNRNNWQNMAIICDVTGSMSPYTKQLLRWFSKNLADQKIHSFTFFNDGDGMRDKKKKIGEVGGIYHTQTRSMAELTAFIMDVMRKGNGDDTPENNLEAAIEAAKNCSDCDLVMIADNYATPRDLRMVEELDRPIRIILCGASPYLNTAYLQLAYDTGGSVHTLFQDITNLKGLANGSTIDFGIFRYRLNNGRFVKEPIR